MCWCILATHNSSILPHTTYSSMWICLTFLCFPNWNAMCVAAIFGVTMLSMLLLMRSRFKMRSSSAKKLWGLNIGEYCLWVRLYFSSWSQKVVARLRWIVWEIGGKWPYNCSFTGCWFQDLLKTAPSIMCSSHLLFDASFSLGSIGCNHTIVLKRL